VTSYFVYYRVDPARVAELRAAVERLFATVERETGVRGRWMRRRDEATTYMEVYENVADERAFEALLEREAAGLGLERKVERFICA
jgi:quinol monooxygenase YgiN